MVVPSDLCTQATLRQLLSDVDALENARDILKNQADAFIEDALGFNLDDLSTPSEMTDDVVNNLTPENMGCDESAISVVGGFIGNCAFAQLSELARKIKKLNKDLVDIVTDLLSVPENLLCQALQDFFGLFEGYGMDNILDALDLKIFCITSSEDAAKYADDIQDINDRIDAVVDDLPMTDTGDFDIDELTEDLDEDLSNNLKIYQAQAESSVAESREDLQKAKASASNLHPANRF
jgi:hypothetical protein